MPQAEYGDPHDEPPIKRYPGTREYFSAPAQETLFPDRDLSGRSGRWLRRPQDWSVALVPDGAGETELGVDLLEIVRVRLAPQVSFGIVHLSVDADLDADRMLATSRALATRYRPADKDTPRLVVIDGAERRELAGSQPLHRLTAALFGDAHEFVALRAYIFAAAQVPAEVDTVHLAAWRRALAQGYGLARAGRLTRAILSETVGALNGSGRQRPRSLGGARPSPFETSRPSRCGIFARTGPRPYCLD